MAGAKGVVFRFITTQKAADASILLDGRQQIAPARQDLVRVCLVTNIPHEAVMRRSEGVMKSDGELNGAQRRACVASHTGHRFQNVLTDFVGDPLKTVDWKLSQIRGRIDLLYDSH